MIKFRTFIFECLQLLSVLVFQVITQTNYCVGHFMDLVYCSLSIYIQTFFIFANYPCLGNAFEKNILYNYGGLEVCKEKYVTTHAKQNTKSYPNSV